MPTLKIEGTGTQTTYRARWSGPVEAGADTEWNDEAGDHEAIGEIVGGTDTYETSGVPLDFATDDPANAWTLNLAVDFGAGWVEWRPTYLNAGTAEVRGQGWYQLSIPEPGMILKAEGPEHDGVLTATNTVAAGNVRGGIDRWRVWPIAGLDVRGDHDLEWRWSDPETEWETVDGYAPAMNF